MDAFVGCYDRVARRATLVISCARQSRPPDHIPSGVNVINLCLVRSVDGNLPSTIGFYPDLVQAHVVGIAGTTIGPEYDIALNFLP